MRRQYVLPGLDDSRAPRRRTAHGITPAERDYLAALQGGLCAVCQRPGQRLQLDHDHRIAPGRIGTRESIRGLLCPRCNGCLGKLGDQNIPRLIAYLTRGQRP